MPPAARTEFRAFDSELEEVYPEHRRFSVAYEPEWQWIRLNLRWANYDDARDSAAICDVYVTRSETNLDRRYRMWRVYNLLCAIPHGQSTQIGIRIIERSVTDILTPYMEAYRLKVLEVGYPEVWDWAAVRHSTHEMFNTSPDMLNRTTQHLLANRSRRSHAKPELRHYLRICLDTMGVEDPLEWRKRE